MSSVPPHHWPGPGQVDLQRHDLPHAASTTEWWYVNAHLKSAEGRAFSVFAAFFRIINKQQPDGSYEYAYSLTWGISDVEKKEYVARSFVDANAPTIGLERIKAGRGARDERLNRAVSEVLTRNKVPLPDRFFPGPVSVANDTLCLDYGGMKFEKTKAGEYRLVVGSAEGPRSPAGATLTFTLQKPPIRHGDDGVVRGVHGEDMFYVFVPRCEVKGTITLDGQPLSVTGQGWYDHEFSAPPKPRIENEKTRSAGVDSGTLPVTVGSEADDRPSRSDQVRQSAGVDSGTLPVTVGSEADDRPSRSDQVRQSDLGVVAWNWVSAQLDDGSDVSVYDLVHSETKESQGRWAIVIDADGKSRAFSDFKLTTTGQWRSVRTFERYPTTYSLELPAEQLSLTVEAEFGDQELVTVISKPAFWEGRCTVKGTRAGKPVQGLGYVERSGFFSAETLDAFFKSVGEAVRESVQQVYPLELSRSHAEKLVAAPGRESVLDGVDLPQLARTLIAPVREITDRGGKAWRSYAALACCDVVLGDSRKFAEWLAFPEFMHVGSLIVDDVQDKSDVRRGGPTAHLKYGEALCINAGTAAYFMGERMLRRSLVKDELKLELYDLYFEALREGHAGQAIDLDGLEAYVPIALDRGEVKELEQRVLAIHRLKTAAPASALARMGALVGGGSRAQVGAVGRYFDSLGLAFQIVDDVLNLRGFKGDLKQRGEDLTHGKVTLPVARALGALDQKERLHLWALVSLRSSDPKIVGEAIALIDKAGALDGCLADARKLIETAWSELNPLVEDSLAKVMLRAFGWYVLERHY